MPADKKIRKNPFQITTPEDLTAQETVDLFVDVFTDFPQIIDPGHGFLMGPRGVGKSMMFRYLQSDCQCIVGKCSFSDLPFLGIYIPIKNESFVKTELKRLDDRHASEIFNEHLMISHIAVKIFDSLIKNDRALSAINADSLFDFYRNTFIPLLYPYDLGIFLESKDKIYGSMQILENIMAIMNQAYRLASRYTNHLSFTNDLPVYDGPLFDYQDFLVPLLSGLPQVDGFPKGTLYLLIDDAHFLSEIQTCILNSWIATRTSRKISFKVSSQYNYKSYYTVTGATIDSPHDYTEMDMTTVYTSTIKKTYKERIRKIVEKRLALEGVFVPVEEFFPDDAEQEEQIHLIAEGYRRKHDIGEGRGFYRSDDAVRYARPDFIRDLAGTRKSSSTYSYSGFDQLVHLSSGIVRYFLEPAHAMYSKEVAEKGSQKILSISPSIQNSVSRKEAEKFLFSELEKYKKEGHEEAIPKEDIEYLSNLVQGLGGLFRRILLSDRSERKVFSMAISDKISSNVERIINIGVNLGFFHRSTIGRKDRKSGGRTQLYVMNRRLAPIWNLDPTGFAGYLFLQNTVLEEGMENPQSMLRRVEKNGHLHEMEYHQLNLFDGYTTPIEVYGEEDEING
ncbi:MAG: hypothetical protein LBL79_14285 [Prevotella sp.]|jgi:hypothetical protein|nr:hypothetical protein [Prevotella sp.]